MKYWNSHDEHVTNLLQAEIADAEAHFEQGPEGGVAVYRGLSLLGVWIEQTRLSFSFVPAAHLQPTLTHCSMEQVIAATRSLLANPLLAPRQIELTA
jgi:hypothetical protein